MVEIIKLLQFGAPEVQKTYKNLCHTIGIDFENFQEKLIEDTGYSYDQLKEFWIYGKEQLIDEKELEELKEIEIDNFLFIHFDIEEEYILGFTAENHKCLTDGFYLFEEDKLPPNPRALLYRKNL